LTTGKLQTQTNVEKNTGNEHQKPNP